MRQTLGRLLNSALDRLNQTPNSSISIRFYLGWFAGWLLDYRLCAYKLLMHCMDALDSLQLCVWLHCLLRFGAQ
jgi:hypothetical protein